MAVSEAVAKGASKGAAVKGMFTPNPGAWLKTWQGLVQLGLRVAVLGIALLAFISACVANSETQFTTFDADLEGPRDRVQGSSGWIIFVTIFTFIVEGLLLALRILNFSLTTTFTTISYIVDIVICGIFAGAYLSGAIALAVYAGQWRDIDNNFIVLNVNPGVIASSAAATSAFSFFSVFAFVGLAVWLVLTLLFKWGQGGEQHAASTEGAE